MLEHVYFVIYLKIKNRIFTEKDWPENEMSNAPITADNEIFVENNKSHGGFPAAFLHFCNNSIL